MSGGAFPSSTEELLLAACLLEGDAASRAYADWSSRTRLDDVEAGSFRLLPLLGLNLARHGVTSPDAGRLRGVHRWAWSRNRLLERTTRNAAALLVAEGFRPLVLKGLSLSASVYRDGGARPMDDGDLAVPFEDAPRAARVLETGGFVPVYPVAGWNPRQTHALPFHDAAGRCLDLHGFVFGENRRPGIDEGLHERAIPMTVEDLSLHRLSPADQLLHTFAHGLRPNPLSPLRWVADAFLILEREGPNLEPLVFRAEASARKLEECARQALAYLSSRFGARVPGDLIPQGRRFPGSTVEKLHLHSLRSLHDPGWRSLWTTWLDMERNAPESANFAEFLRRVLRNHDLESPAKLLQKGPGKLLRTMRRTLLAGS